MVLIVFILGLLVGSFLNVFILRLHVKQNFIKGRSHCPKCHKKISWFDNIPVISFILLQGKCRHCRKNISWQYPLVELSTGILFVISFMIHFPVLKAGQMFVTQYQIMPADYIGFIRDIIFCSILVVIFIYDLRWYLILDKVVLPSIFIAFAFNILLGLNIYNLILAALIGGGFFLAQFFISRGRWIGGGDIRLGVLLGAMLGWPNIIVALFLAYISGSVIGIILLMNGLKKWSSQIPFGTFLSIAAIITLWWGPDLLNWYIKHMYIGIY